jgi:hypothetical protein
MATFSGLPGVRDDFRCSLCRQKNTFHCEHDTPYRDQLLGTYDQEKPHIATTNSRRTSQRIGSHNNNSNNHSTRNNDMHNAHTGRNANSNSDARHQQGKRPDNNPVLITNANGSTGTYEQKKKNKSCVIL